MKKVNNTASKMITEKRDLECLLTVDEVTARAQSLAHTIKEKTEILAEKKEINSGFKERLDGCEKVIINCSNCINTGKESRDVECEVKLNTPADGTKTITRTDTGESWEEQMNWNELQEEIF